MTIIFCLIAFALGFLLRKEIYPARIRTRAKYHVLQASFISNNIDEKLRQQNLNNADKVRLEKQRDEHRAIAVELNSLLTKQDKI